MYSHMQKDCLHERSEPVSFAVWHVYITKVPQIPAECLSILARMAKKEKARNNSPAATGVSLKKTLQ